MFYDLDLIFIDWLLFLSVIRVSSAMSRAKIFVSRKVPDVINNALSPYFLYGEQLQFVFLLVSTILPKPSKMVHIEGDTRCNNLERSKYVKY